MTTFAIVGPGRAGQSFDKALQVAGWTLASVSGRGDDISGLGSTCDVIMLTVPDDAIGEVAASIRPGSAAVVHTSGATTLDPLKPHDRRGSVHPLMSLPEGSTGAERLRSGIAFAIDGDPITSRIVEALDGRGFHIENDLRSVYHAGASVAANHLVVLCAQVERLATQAKVPVDVYWDLMSTTLQNVRRQGALPSLTGPAARGDQATLNAHINAIGEAEAELYRVLSTEARRLGTDTNANTEP